MSQPTSFKRKLAWILLVAALAIVGAVAIHHRLTRPDPPPVLHELPDFRLTNRDGRTITRADLLGKPWIADFIFTRCEVSCPLMTQRMKALTRRLEGYGEVNYVSITVDPDHDTPEVLEAYAKKNEAPPNWLFLTGPRDDVFRLSREGFLLGIDLNPPPGATAPGEPILHSTRFVLIDGKGRMRGSYEAFSDTTVDRIKRDLEGLRGEGR